MKFIKDRSLYSIHFDKKIRVTFRFGFPLSLKAALINNSECFLLVFDLGVFKSHIWRYKK